MERFKLGLKPIEHLSNEYLKDSLFDKKDKSATYSMKRVLVGVNVRTGALYYLDTSNSLRIVVLGRNRTGKTFFIRGFRDRAVKSGFCAISIIDPKDEFKSSTKPVQDKFKDKLAPNEKPEGMSAITLRPTYFKSIENGKELPSGNTWHSIDINELTLGDFKTLLRTERMKSDKMKQSVDNIFHRMKDRKINTVEEIKLIVDELDITEQEMQALRYRFEALENSHFFEPHNVKSIIKAMGEGVIPSINQEFFDDFGMDSLALPPVYTGVLIRQIKNARINGEIPPVWIIADESPLIVPKVGNPSCKKDILRSIKLDARYNVNWAFLTQEIDAVDPEIFGQSKYIFVPYNADMNTFVEVLKMASIGYIQNRNNMASRIKGHMKKFEWMVIDMDGHGYDIITPLAPLSAHAETQT